MKKPNKYEISAILLVFCVISVYFFLPDVAKWKTKNPLTTQYIELRKQEALLAKKDFNLQWTWISLRQIPAHFIYAVMYTEDSRFLEHKGFDLDRIYAAFKMMWKEKKFIVGASTITQQTARNLYLSPEKTIWRKILEISIAIKLELFLTKERILEIYLNCAEWGDGIFGVEAAAQYWFHCSASQLNLEQSVRLVLNLRCPLLRKPTQNSVFFNKEINYLILTLAEQQIISRKTACTALVDLQALR